ncbi:hypothetical protein DB346_24420 [Verrucomicrobia bacterium LW23]|nr:hypothetical protein DB346_24420 [Verrucomicrobia bacterium LW23]
MTTPAPSADILFQFEEYIESCLKAVFQQRGFPNVYTMSTDHDTRMVEPRLCIAAVAADSEQEDSFLHPAGIEYYSTAAVDVDLVTVTSRRNQPHLRKIKGEIREIMQRVPFIARAKPELLPYHNIVRCVSQKPTHDADPELERDTVMMPYQLIVQIRPEAWPAQLPA